MPLDFRRRKKDCILTRSIRRPDVAGCQPARKSFWRYPQRWTPPTWCSTQPAASAARRAIDSSCNESRHRWRVRRPSKTKMRTSSCASSKNGRRVDQNGARSRTWRSTYGWHRLTASYRVLRSRHSHAMAPVKMSPGNESYDGKVDLLKSRSVDEASIERVRWRSPPTQH